MEKMETLEREYRKVSKVLEFMMPLLENMDEDFKRQFFEKRKEQIIGNFNGRDLKSISEHPILLEGDKT